MLVDVVLYSGEKELLDLRLDFLQADKTIVIQGTHSFTGHKKTIYRVPKKVISVIVESNVSANAWENEKNLRLQGAEKLHELDLPQDAIVGYFDVDEIPDPEIIRKTNQITAWDMPKFQMSLAWFQPLEAKEGLTGFSALWHQVRNQDTTLIRKNRHTYSLVNAGWHLSSFMTLEDLKTKWRNFSHQELIKGNWDEWIENCWINGLAVENGKMLTQQSLQNLPERFLKLPDYMKRTRA